MIVHVDSVANGVTFRWICVKMLDVKTAEFVCTLWIVLQFVNVEMDSSERDVRKNALLDSEVFDVIFGCPMESVLEEVQSVIMAENAPVDSASVLQTLREINVKFREEM